MSSPEPPESPELPTSPSFESVCEEVARQLDEGDGPGAFTSLRPLLADAQAELEPADFHALLVLLARCSELLAGPDYAVPFHALAANPTDLEHVHAVAYELHEQRQFAIAARVLGHGLALAPNHPRLLAELVPNLEATMRNVEAVVMLQRSGLVGASPLFAYSLAFNAVMIGEMELAKASVARLHQSFAAALTGEKGEALAGMVRSVEAMIARHAALTGVCALDAHDLTGWQLVLGGGALLHLSPAGLEDAMRGRYALIQDTPALLREGAESLRVVLGALGLGPTQVLAGPERGAQIVAELVGAAAGLPVRGWSPERAEEPGLVVVDEFEAIEDNHFFERMSHHRPGQLLFAHASCWTDPFFYTPDATTLLHQHRVAPWGAGRHLLVEGEDGLEVQSSEADGRTVAEIVGSIQAAGEDAGEDAEGEDAGEDAEGEALVRAQRAGLIAGLEALRELPEAQRPGLLREAGRRSLQRQGSPVPSNQFT